MEIFLIQRIAAIFVLCLLCNEAYPSAGSGRVVSKYDWQWFFYEKSSGRFGNVVVYRPFFLEAEKDDNLFQASLMPLFFWRYKNERKDVRKGLFGFYESDRYLHEKNKADNDTGLFPFFYYGSGAEKEDDYLFVYPFGGTINGKFGLDYMSPYIFPGIALFFLYPPASLLSFQTLLWGLIAMVPLYMNYGRGDYNAHAVLWPLIMWGESGTRRDFRIFPFYSRSYKKDWYDNYTYLMLINYRHTYFANDDRYTFFFFPFFGRKWSRSGEASAATVLYPFFSWGVDRKRGSREINMPWPLVQIADSRSPYTKKRIFFPFYGEYKYRNYTSTFITPFYFNITNRTDSVFSSYTYNFILCWYFKRDYTVRHSYYGNSWRYFKIWPLLNIEWSDSGLYSINILSLLPFRDAEGYEKLYSPFWTLFEYRKSPEGMKHLGLLFRTYYQVWDDNYFKFKIPVIISYERKDDNLRELTFLLGAFGYDSDAKGSYLRLLWIPIRVGDGYKDDEVKIAEDENVHDTAEFARLNFSNITEFENSVHYSWRVF